MSISQVQHTMMDSHEHPECDRHRSCSVKFKVCSPSQQTGTSARPLHSARRTLCGVRVCGGGNRGNTDSGAGSRRRSRDLIGEKAAREVVQAQQAQQPNDVGSSGTGRHSTGPTGGVRQSGADADAVSLPTVPASVPQRSVHDFVHGICHSLLSP
eukprot:COSAG02_NODE_31_length_50774_cov_1928.118204_33_plen_155_part_00